MNRSVVRPSPAILFGALLLLLHLGLALLGPMLAPYGFAQMQVLHTLEPPSRAFLAGTDQFGRDQLSRVMWGARRTLAVALISTRWASRSAWSSGWSAATTAAGWTRS